MAVFPQQRNSWVAPGAVLGSAALHVALVVLGAGLLHSGWFQPARGLSPEISQPAPAPEPHTIDIDLPDFHGELPLPASSAPVTSPQDSSLPGGSDIPRPDMDRRGRGGTDHASQPGTNLADHDHGIRLAKNVASHIDRDQIPRILSDSLRRSWENQRLTTQPMELTFLASGKGERQERRPPSDRDPSAGSKQSRSASTLGADVVGRPPLPPGFDHPIQKPGASSLGTDVEAPGLGVANALPGHDQRTSANVAHARPLVDKGNPSIPAPLAGSPKDNIDADQHVASVHQSLMDASTGGGKPGPGSGGQRGPGPTGHGGLEGSGSRSSPLGYGPGSQGWRGGDPKLDLYRRRVIAKIWPYWEDAFPRWARAEMRQGRVIIVVSILADGSLRAAQVTRPSGIDEFDQNCLQAVRQAAPFEPLPKSFPSSVLRWELSFDASNPLVR